MGFNVDGARQAGYSDTEIADYLGAQSKLDAKAARGAGYSDSEIIDHLTAQPSLRTAPAPRPIDDSKPLPLPDLPPEQPSIMGAIKDPSFWGEMGDTAGNAIRKADNIGKDVATGQHLTHLADDAPAILSTIGGEVENWKSGVQEYNAEQQKKYAQRRIAQSILLPQILKDYREKGIPMRDNPLTQEHIKESGDSVDEFLMDWSLYGQMNEQQLKGVYDQAKQRLDDADNTLRQTSIDRARTQYVVAGTRPKDMSPFSGRALVFDGLTSVPDLLVGVGGSMVAGPEVGVAMMGSGIAPRFYTQAKNEGADHKKATTYATLMTLAQVAPQMPVLEAIADTPAGKAAMNKIVGKLAETNGGKVLGTAAMEGISGSITQGLQIGIDKGVLDKDMSFSEALEAIARAGIISAGVGAAVGGPAIIAGQRGRNQDYNLFDNLPPKVETPEQQPGLSGPDAAAQQGGSTAPPEPPPAGPESAPAGAQTDTTASAAPAAAEPTTITRRTLTDAFAGEDGLNEGAAAQAVHAQVSQALNSGVTVVQRKRKGDTTTITDPAQIDFSGVLSGQTRIDIGGTPPVAAAPVENAQSEAPVSADAVPPEMPIAQNEGTDAAPEQELSPNAAFMDVVPSSKGSGWMITEHGKPVGPAYTTRAAAESDARAVGWRPAKEAGLEQKQAAIDDAAHAAATSPRNDLPQPTAAQKEAENYKTGEPVKIHGKDVRVENPEGSYRTNLDVSRIDKFIESEPAGVRNYLRNVQNAVKGHDIATAVDSLKIAAKKSVNKPLRKYAQTVWANKQLAHYGRFVGTKANDGDARDVFLGPKSADESLPVYVVDANHPGTKDYDESKSLVGFPSKDAALEAYRGSYDKDFANTIIRDVREFSPDEFKRWLNDPKAETIPASEWGRQLQTEAPKEKPSEKISTPVKSLPAPKKDGKKEAAKPDASKDSLLEYLAKHNTGLSSTEAVAQGLDPKQLSSNDAIFGIRRSFRKNGMSFDQAAELLHDAGYPVTDEKGNYSANALLDAIDRELRGNKVYSTKNESWMEKEYAPDPSDMPPDSDYYDAQNAAMVARAAEIDGDAVDKLADKFANDTDGFMIAVKELIRDHDTKATVAHGEENKPSSKTETPKTEAKAPVGDLFGEDVSNKQAIADEIRKRDAKRNSGQDSIETGDPGDMFSQAKNQADIEDEQPKQSEKNKGEEPPNKKSANKIFTDEAVAAARARLKEKLRNLNSGFDPEMLLDSITIAGHHIESGARTFAQFAKEMLNDLGEAIRPYLKSIYMAAKYDPRFADIKGMSSAADVEATDVALLGAKAEDQLEGSGNVPSGNTDLERHSINAAVEDAAVAPDVQGKELAIGIETARKQSRSSGRGHPDDQGISNGGTALPRELSDKPVHRADAENRPAEFPARNSDGERSDDPGFPGVPPESVATEQVESATVDAHNDAAKREQQRAADSVAVKPGIANVRETLPYLLAGQQEDVHKAETRYAKPDGYGFLLTNGTGTGKTFSGLGAIKRYARRGKSNVLIVVPDDKIAADWMSSGKALSLDIGKLVDTKDAGKGVTITTYANLGQNDELARRKWDLVVPDEAHSLMQAADGKDTLALDALRAISMHPRGEFTRYQMLNREDIEKRAEIGKNIIAIEKMISDMGDNDPRLSEMNARSKSQQKEYEGLTVKLDSEREKIKAEVAAAQGAGRTRMLALSATPFAYDKTIDWAEGYLFDYADPTRKNEDDGAAYNSGNSREKFFMNHFGYRMRYNKLTQPDSNVDSGLMQRQFNSWLKKEGSLSGRMLDVKADYDRRFVLVESAIGNDIDRAMDYIETQRKDHSERNKAALEGKQEYPAANGWDILGEQLNSELYGKLGHLTRRYLLEAIKAKEVIPHIHEHLAKNRKIVVFHDFKKGGARNPFDFPEKSMPSRAQMPHVGNAEYAEMKDKLGAYNAAAAEFRKEFPTLSGQGALSELISPIDRFKKEFPNVLLINGDEKKSDLLNRYKRFQDDASGPIVALVQSDKNKGWSGHDTTGKHQRALFNLGLPTQPTKSIQQEGRIYRTGQVSNAMFRYLNTGTNWERWAFAQTIAERASAAENLGMGEQARALKDAYIAGFEESSDFRAGHEGEGTGGKERDRLANEAITEYDRAKAFYYGTAKKTSKTKAQEGKDYFATPEPLGQKMIEWADQRAGEDFLEPSAGHGAIARWAGEKVNRTAIEPSNELGSRLAMVFDGKIIRGDFESHNIVNKYDTIVMNPPFGSGGRTAIDHLEKAARHLRTGGRIVAIIPAGPSADAKFDKWFYADEGSGINLHLVGDIKLPAVTFERAGTKVMSRVLIIDKPAEGDSVAPQVNRDISSIDDINQLFDRLENMEIRPREKAAVNEYDQASPTTQKQATQATGSVDRGELPTVTHTTSKGKVLRGVVRRDLTLAQAKKIDPFTFKKDAGFFIREKYLAEAKRATGKIVGKLSDREVRDEVNKVLKGFVVRPRMTVVRTFSELPKPVIDSLARRGITSGIDNGGLATQAVFYKGGTYFIADAIPDLETVRQSVLHETVIHYGLDNLLPSDAKNAILDEIAKTQPLETMKRGTDEYGKPVRDSGGKLVSGYDHANVKQRRLAAEEVLAHHGQKYLDGESLPTRLKRLVERWLADIRAALSRLFGKAVPIDKLYLKKLLQDLRAHLKSGEALSKYDHLSEDALNPEESTAKRHAQMPVANWDVTGSKVDSFLHEWQDHHIDTKRVTEAIEAFNKQKIADDKDPYLAEELYHQRTAHRVKTFLVDELHPLLEKTHKLGVSLADLEHFLWARHAEERNNIMAARNPTDPTMQDGGSGMTTAAARAYLAGIPVAQRSKLDFLAAHVDHMIDKTRQTLVGYGLESPSTVNLWKTAFGPHYVPLHRADYQDQSAMGIGQGFSVKGSSSKAALGSHKPVANILAEIALQRERAIVRGEKNRLGVALYGLAKANPNPDWWTVDRVPRIRQLDKSTGLVTSYPDSNYKNRDNVIVFREPNRRGRVVEKAIVFNKNNERAMRMAVSLKNLDSVQLEAVMGVMSKISRYVSAVNTQYNPVFGVFNLWRDIQDGLLNATSTPIRNQKAKLLKYSLASLKGIYQDARAIRRGQHPSSPNAKLFEEMESEGGSTGYRDIFRTSAERAQAIIDELKRFGESNFDPRRAARAVGNWLSDYNLAMENAVRVAAYRAAREQGISKPRSASISKNITINFNRRGRSGQQANALYAFFNASVQGAARNIQTLKGPAGKSIVAGAVLLGVVQAIALAIAGFDDDEPPEFVKRNNLIIPIGDGKYLRGWPLPYGLRYLVSAARSATEATIRGGVSASDALLNSAGAVADSFNPLGSSTPLQTVLPTAVDPLAALAENKDFTGRKIYQEKSGPNDPSPGFTRSKDTASTLAKGAAWGINRMSGGTDYVAGSDNPWLSPTADQIDYLIGEAAGGLGREISKGEQTVTALANGDDLPTYKIPLIGRLYGSTNERAAERDHFYKLVREGDRHKAEMMGRATEGEDARARVHAYQEEHPGAEVSMQAAALSDQITKMRGDKRQMAKAGVSRDRLKAVDDQIADMIHRVVEADRHAEAP
jgi:hypothetical protein